MPRAYVSAEVEVLRFFEVAPLEKAEMLFNIVKEKMRGRLAGNTRNAESAPKKKRHSAPKQGEEEKRGDELAGLSPET
jgi:hypothetical protein